MYFTVSYQDFTFVRILSLILSLPVTFSGVLSAKYTFYAGLKQHGRSLRVSSLAPGRQTARAAAAPGRTRLLFPSAYRGPRAVGRAVRYAVGRQ